METTTNTNDYKTKQLVARRIEEISSIQRWDNNTLFNIYFNDFGNFIDKVIKLEGTFASKVAETIDKTMNPYGYKIASVSKKQAWIIACAVVENNIDYSEL